MVSRLGYVAVALLFLSAKPMLPAPRLFADEFSGHELDRSKWNVIVTGRTVNEEQQAYVDSTDVLYVKDGALVIQPRFRAGFKTAQANTFDFISGRIDTRAK